MTTTPVSDNHNNLPNSELAEIKNELLAKIQELESKLSLQIQVQTSETNQNFIDYSTRLNDLSEKYTSLSSSVTEQKVKIAKIDDFESFKRKADDQLITHEIRLANTMKDLANAKFKYDKMFIENLTVPGYIGECSQYKTMREYIDYNIGIVQTLVSAKDKLQQDMKEYRQQADLLLKDYLNIINTNSRRCNEYTDQQIEKIKKLLSENKDDFNEKCMELRVDNTKVSMDLKAKMNEFMDEWDKILQIRDDIYKKLNDHLYIYKNDFNTTQKDFADMKKEFKAIKSKFRELVEFIKDVRFRKNLGTLQEVKKKDITALTQKLKFSRKHSKSIDLSEPEVDLNYDFFTGETKNNDDIKNSIVKKKTYDEDVLLEKKEEEEMKKPFGERLSKFQISKEIVSQHRNSYSNKIKINISPLTPKNQELQISSKNNKENQETLEISNETENRNQFPKITIKRSQSPKLTKLPSSPTQDKCMKTMYSQFNSRPVMKTDVNFYNSISPIANVVELDFNDRSKDKLFKYGNNLSNNNELNAEFKPIDLKFNKRSPKKFKTIKENSSRIKSCFGSTISSFSKKDIIACKNKNTLGNVGLIARKK